MRRNALTLCSTTISASCSCLPKPGTRLQEQRTRQREDPVQTLAGRRLPHLPVADHRVAGLGNLLTGATRHDVEAAEESGVLADYRGEGGPSEWQD